MREYLLVTRKWPLLLWISNWRGRTRISDTQQRYWRREEVVQTEEEKISRNPIGSPWLVIANWKKISVPSRKRNDTEKVIVQSSISRMSHDQRLMSWNLMVMILTLLASHFLLHHQVVIQMYLNEYWIRALPITFVSEGSCLLALRSRMAVWYHWEMIKHDRWLVRVQFISGCMMRYWES